MNVKIVTKIKTDLQESQIGWTVIFSYLPIAFFTDHDHVSWVDLRLGERFGGKCRRKLYSRSQTTGTMFHVAKRLDLIDWFYHVRYGERRT